MGASLLPLRYSPLYARHVSFSLTLCENVSSINEQLNEQCKKHHRVLNVEQVGLTGTIISHGGFPTHSQFDTESGTARVATQLCWLDYYNRWR